MKAVAHPFSRRSRATPEAPNAWARRTPRRAGSLLRQGAFALGLAGLLAACGGGDGDAGGTVGEVPAATAADAALAPEVRAVRDYLRDWYLWNDRLPAADLTGLTSAEATLEALRARPLDRYSFVEPRATAAAFFERGRTVGLGLGFTTTADGRVELRFVQPGSPAAAAGLARGDRILAVDGRAVADLIAAGALSEAFGEPREGLAVALRLDRGAGPFDVTVTKASYEFQSVQADRVIADGGRRVGYVYLSSFAEPTRQAWRQALQRLADAGAQDLLVDLRDNGGGRLSVAAEVAGTLAPAGASGEPFWRVKFNERHAGANYTVPLSGAPGAGFARVVMLTSGVTCSAAELLDFGLRPYRPVESVGTTTCGKPVGFVPQPVGSDKLLNAVTFGGANRDAEATYFEGLAPRCTATDDRRHPFGDPADPLVAAALAWLRDGACPQAAAAGDADARKQATGVDRARQAAHDAREAARPWRGPLDWAGLH